MTTSSSKATVATISMVSEKLSEAIKYEMGVHDVGSVSVSLIYDGKPVWKRGFGYTDQEKTQKASASTIYRVGSISKLFTEIVIMLLVEDHMLSLDAPITQYLPELALNNRYTTPLTIRHLMSHRSGLIREPIVGHYFDATSPSLTDTVNSLNQTTLVFEPGTDFKYSNAGIAILGAIIEAVTGEDYQTVIQERIFAPAAMVSSKFKMNDVLKARAAVGMMQSYDGARFIAPQFEMGAAPAGNLYSSVEDLTSFLMALLEGGQGANGRIATDSMLERMWTPQGKPGDRRNLGLGFMLKEVSGVRTVGHGGAIYGFVADAQVAPDAGVGIAIAANLDSFSDIKVLSEYAMELLLAAKSGGPLPTYQMSTSPNAKQRQEVKGYYKSKDRMIVIREHGTPWDDDSRLFIEGLPQISELRRFDGSWIAESGPSVEEVVFDQSLNTMRVEGEVYKKITWRKPTAPDPSFAGLIGQYGWDHNYIRVYEWDGQPHIRIEWLDYSRIKQLSNDEYAFVDSPYYPYETLKFERDETGKGISISLNGIIFKRRAFGDEFRTFLRDIMLPISDLKVTARTASPPEESGTFRPSDLVDLKSVDETIVARLNYASTNNIIGQRLYDEAKAIMQRPAANAIGRVSKALREKGYGLWVHDAYRPWYVTKIFWDMMPESGKSFVANPNKGSRHNRGAAIDLTLYDLETGKPVQMTGGFDEVSMRSHPYFIGGSGEQRWHRDLLHREMTAQDFSVYEYEWWHFDYRDWKEYAIQNESFEDID
ncbi:MAG: serine hydrolase [Pseudomonadota bacterium]